MHSSTSERLGGDEPREGDCDGQGRKHDVVARVKTSIRDAPCENPEAYRDAGQETEDDRDHDQRNLHLIFDWRLWVEHDSSRV